MKTGFRLSPSSLIFVSFILSALFLFSSSPIFSPLSVSSAHAASLEQQLVRLRADISQLLKKRTYAPALSKVKRYVMLTARKYGQRHERYASALDLQAKIYRYLKRPREARRYKIRAAAIRKNNRNFRAKQKADMQNRLAEMRKSKAKMKARMQQQRRRQGTVSGSQHEKRRQLQKRMRKNTANARRLPMIRPKPVPRPTMRGAARPSTSHAYRMPAAPSKIIRRRAMRTAPASSRKSRAFSTRSATTKQGGVSKSKSLAPPPKAAMLAPPEPAMAPSQTAKKAIDPAAKPENHTIVKVYFATDRQRTKSLKLASLFGGQPSDPKRISYGICEVSIPKGHKPGQLEAPSIWRFEFTENPDKHVVLLKVHPQEKKTYFRNLKHIISSSKGQNAFIFIHGYNVTFHDAARRTAQISYDLGFDGAPVFYSWPSTGELAGYPTDEDNVLWAQENIKQFLKDFVEKTDAKNIYLIAHSMGSRALTGAVASLIGEEPQFKKRFKEIILAAPDISARIFRDNIAPRMIEASNNITLYVSADDKALLASRKFHANPRAGEAGQNMILFKGIDTIDATGIDASLLAHSYFAEAKSIISDILSIFRGNRPATRKTLKRIETKRGNYWVFATQ
jgi:esterase/lipase superfamily enzyme